MHDEVPGLAAAAGLAEVVELEERRPGHQMAAAQPGEKGHAPGGRDQARAGPGGEHGGGQVDQLAVLAPGPGGDHGHPAGAQQHLAAGQDRREPGEQVIEAVVGQVGRVAAVAVVVFLDPAAAVTLLGANLTMHAGTVRRGGDHQRGPPGHPGRQQRGQLAGVTADHLTASRRAAAAGMGDVGGGDLGPAVLELDAEAVAAQMDGLDQGGADTAHRVGDQVPWLGVTLDGGGGDGGQHLGRVRHRFGQVPAAALGAGVLLGGHPDRQRRVRHRRRAGPAGPGPGRVPDAG